jgi:hypothetical protein
MAGVFLNNGIYKINLDAVDMHDMHYFIKKKIFFLRGYLFNKVHPD